VGFVRVGLTNTSASDRRLMCPVCQRPQKTCICCWVTPVAQDVPVLILQHPLEVNNPKGSARLLHLSLSNSMMLTGEMFEAADGRYASGRHVLLYPRMPAELGLEQQGLPEGFSKPLIEPSLVDDASEIRLVVIDATWRKSRKMLHLNPWLQKLPRLSLNNPPLSRYRIRKAHQPHQLSTLEATCAALAQLEGNSQKFEPLLTAFDGFVVQQMGLARRDRVDG